MVREWRSAYRIVVGTLARLVHYYLGIICAQWLCSCIIAETSGVTVAHWAPLVPFGLPVPARKVHFMDILSDPLGTHSV